ncbi:MAG: major capsid protein [Microviridae sp.]|nr:MAG: major capsid protein [Microviridae sp.]
MHRNKSVNTHSFAMVPRADIPRSGFKIESSYKTTFDSGYLVPIYCEEVLPGDTFNLKATMFARLATPIVPIMDNLYLESFFFFVPNRLVWQNWQRFCGEQMNPGETTDYVVPKIGVNSSHVTVGSIFDYFGIPGAGQLVGGLAINALPFRAYNLIWNEWFRDENLQQRVTQNTSDSDSPGNYALKRRGKRHDYFTSCLPWVQKGASVSLPLGSSAPVKTNNDRQQTGNGWPVQIANTGTGNLVNNSGDLGVSAAGAGQYNATGITGVAGEFYIANLYADLSKATAATINQLRQAFQIQKLLERDARGGTRYTEMVKAHFGVTSPDARLQRPEYLGGGMTPISISPVAQTMQATNGLSVGTLGAFATATAHNHGFTQSFTEHGHVIGLISVRADLNYQQGCNRMWFRKTRYDYYWPVFAMLGEQAVLNQEIFCTGQTGDESVFGYQERWAEYRYKPSLITGMLRSTYSEPLDLWHLAQKFASVPSLNDTFIQDHPPISRVIQTTEQTGQEFVLDVFFRNKAARPLPMYSVPGLIDHF